MTMMDLKETKVEFDELLHLYTLPTEDGNKILRGITPIVSAVYHTYDCVDEATLKKAAEVGKNYHKQYQFETENEFYSEACKSQKEEEDKRGLAPIRCEFLVSDEERIASAIDIVYINEKGEIILCDIKTTSDVHYDEWRLQLSIYKYLFELQTGKKVSGLVVAHINKHDYKCNMLDIQPLEVEEVKRIIEDYFSGKELIAKPEQKGLAVVKDYEGAMLKYLRLEAEIKAFKEKFNDLVLKTMQENGDKSYKTDCLSITRVLETSKKSFDSKKFKEDYPELFEKYQKESVTKEHLLIKAIA